MIEAQLLIAKDGTYSEWGPWMPRGGNVLIATGEGVESSGSASVVIDHFTKNSEDSGPGQNADTAGTPTTKITLTGVGRVDEEWEGENPGGTIQLEELVRFRYTITSDMAGEWLLFRMLWPIWFDDVHA